MIERRLAKIGEGKPSGVPTRTIPSQLSWCCVSHMPMRRPRRWVGEGGFFVASAATAPAGGLLLMLLPASQSRNFVGAGQWRARATC